MRHFKLPLIVTGIVLIAAIIVGAVMVTSIHRSAGSSQRKAERAQQAGGEVAVGALIIITPFWLVAAGKVGKKRREARLKAREERKAMRR